MKILFLGGGYTSHLMVIANAIKSIDPLIELDYLSEIGQPKAYKYEFPFPMDRIVTINHHYPKLLYIIPKLRKLLRKRDYHRTLAKIQDNTYDYVHFEFIDPWNCLFIREFKRIGKTLMATPWGSDVYRATKYNKEIIVDFFREVDVVTAMNTVMKETLINDYCVNPETIVPLSVAGTIALDNIVNNRDLTKEEAKRNLGLANRFTIVCGTNASPSQQHIQIIEQLETIKEELPNNTTLMVLLGRDAKYDEQVSNFLKKSGYDIKVFKRRITDKEMLYWRKAADLMIHAQPTDSESGAMMEALLCGTIIVNAKWLKYPKLEKWGMPYYTFDSFDSLAGTVLDAISNKLHIAPRAELVNMLESYTTKNVIGELVNFYKTNKKSNG